MYFLCKQFGMAIGRQINKDYTICRTECKKNEKNEQVLRETWDTIKHANICIIEDPGREEKRNVENI